jgi:hypothetical protein
MANAALLRVGPLGDVVGIKATIVKGGAPTVQFFASIQKQGMTAFATEPAHLPHRGIAVAFAEDALRHDVETHAVGFGSHPLDRPYFNTGRLLIHASRHVLAWEFQTAALAGMASYTLTGPRRDLAGPELVIEDCAAILDEAPRDVSCRLRLSNGPTPNHAFRRILDARDAVRGVPGLGLTYHLGAEHYTDPKQRGIDDYRATLRELPPDTLFVYGNCHIDEHGLGWADYHAGRPAAPDPVPFLHALREVGRPATLLVAGIKPEFDAVELLTAANWAFQEYP